ncbi:hypothetical protein BpHYR1_000118 [Brachionus plicatilis]|uniref:Uncharacterized protein n=1 Tax=Brachionus plicatilis TaxID=10195 RepID=A0A3M7P725_BRAPC|nr:hypothetical protein BpHYR1_000118 [Brachionus plicatilis]
MAYDWNIRDKRIVHYQGNYYVKSDKEEDKPTKEIIKQRYDCGSLILKLRTWITKPFIQFIGFKFRNTNSFEMTPFITN